MGVGWGHGGTITHPIPQKKKRAPPLCQGGGAGRGGGASACGTSATSAATPPAALPTARPTARFAVEALSATLEWLWWCSCSAGPSKPVPLEALPFGGHRRGSVPAACPRGLAALRRGWGCARPTGGPRAPPGSGQCARTHAKPPLLGPLPLRHGGLITTCSFLAFSSY